MGKKRYLILKFTDYGYEIYAITGTKKIKLNKKDKMIMYPLLSNYEYIIKNENTYIFPDYRLITLNFTKEKLKSKPKKVNRNKSKKIIAGILIILTLISGAMANKDIEVLENDTLITIEKLLEDIYTEENQITYNDTAIFGETDSTEPTISFVAEQEDEIIIPETTPSFEYEEVESETIEQINEFNYEYENPNDKEALINAQEYMEVFYKYEKIYGVDAKLLCAIGAQESSGVHHKESKNGGYATGIMGIEYIWDGGEIRVFNFEKNCYETIIVDYSRIGELDYNVKIGAAIFQNYFYNTLKKSDTIDENEYLPFTLQKYNMGPGNMNKVLSCNGNWIDNRDMINAGDKHYFEHVLSRLDNGTIIRIRLSDGSYCETKLINTALEKQYTRT